MKKLFLSLFVATALVSCNRDNDDPTTEQDVPLPVKLISYNGEDRNATPVTNTLEYDGSKLTIMSKIYTINGKTKTDRSIIKYEGNLISSIDDSSEDELYKTDFKYDANGNLTEEIVYLASSYKKSITNTVIKYAINGKTIIMTSKSEDYYENQLNSIEEENYVLTLDSNKQVLKKEGTISRTTYDNNGASNTYTFPITNTYTYDGKNAILKNVAGISNLSYSDSFSDYITVSTTENLSNRKGVYDKHSSEDKYEYTYNQQNYPININLFSKDGNGNFEKMGTIKVEYNK